MSLLKTLSHPNVLKFVGLYYSDDKLHLVTEFIDNGTLQRLIMDDSVPLSWGLKIELAGDIANGMAFLHERSVIHRDLKTENCLVRSDMSVVVADFGLARVMRGQQLKKKHPSESKLRHSVRISSSSGGVAPHFQPQAMTVVGTPDFMAPELFFGKDYNETVDVFSFAVILCSLLGRMEPDPDEIRSNKFGLDEKKIRPLIPDTCPEPLIQLMMKCAALDPKHRPSFEDVDAELYLLDLKYGFGTTAKVKSAVALSTPASALPSPAKLGAKIDWV
eukprot:TRINITY_DN9658_c0_g1_i6.p2 TRINITY_DN9658_c0_g1~~TRINITY_DN9658_c0_g1_i6.p2  ORF type:complete len:275 (+),score=57.06 TRINITY_DN9658_c0_g1_i6:1392-2216(+)